MQLLSSVGLIGHFGGMSMLPSLLKTCGRAIDSTGATEGGTGFPVASRAR